MKLLLKISNYGLPRTCPRVVVVCWLLLHYILYPPPLLHELLRCALNAQQAEQEEEEKQLQLNDQQVKPSGAKGLPH